MIRFFSDLFSVFPKTWNWFWFQSNNNESLANLGLFRIFFCAVMFFAYLSRAFDVELFYSENGLLPSWHKANISFFQFHPTILSGITNPLILHAAHTLFLLLLLCLMVGFRTKIVAPLTYFMQMMFVNRNMSVMFGVDMIANFYFLYLCFANSGARYSIDSLQAKTPEKSGLFSHIAWRLMQVQLCVIYGYSGMEKLKGTRWWDGSAIWDVLSMGSMQRWDLSFVAHTPLLLAAAVYIVLFWEIYFPILVWVPRLRLIMLLFGLQMHIGIFLFMNLPSFGFMMISLYLLFLKKDEVEFLVSKIPWATRHN